MPNSWENPMPKRRYLKISRRQMLKLASATAAGAVISGGLKGGWGAARALAKAKETENPAQFKYSACDMCFNKCGLIARVENGVVKKLDPNPHYLKSRGMLCARGNAGVKQIYDPNRLKYPLLRTGKARRGQMEADILG
jgi:thiosulfate reductase/polysulfide reductase chain A